MLSSINQSILSTDSSVLEKYRNYHNCDDLNSPITEIEISRSVQSLKVNKSPGLDGLPSEFYKYTLPQILPYLYKLVNAIFETCTFPLEWSHSIITPIHKKGSLHDPGNYRGVSSIDSISKAFVFILNSRFSKWCDKCDVIDEAQAVFPGK